MESFLDENFFVKAKDSSEEALQRWRELCGFVKNRKRRFRFTANLSKRSEAKAIRRSNRDKFRVSRAAPQFTQGLSLPSDYTVLEEVKAEGFQICADEVGSIVERRDVKKLKRHGGVETIADKLGTSSIDGISTSDKLLNKRKEKYGVNKFIGKPSRGFLVYVWEALQDTTLVTLVFCAFVSLLVGIMTEGWPKGAHDGLGIVASILLGVFVTATSDYKRSLQFKDLVKKKKITVQVTRDGFERKLSIYDLLPGDIVHLSTGDLVPADGLFVSGIFLLINESSLTGQSEPVNVNSRNPFLFCGTKVEDGIGSCKMLVTTVGMRTRWGKLMASRSEGGDDETPLQVKLNGVATIIGKICLFFAVVTFSVLVQRLFSHKRQQGSHLIWSGDEALEILEYFAIAVTNIVVAVPGGLPLAVTLILALAMMKMMNHKALIRHLAARETMGSATTICSNKTGTLTTNHMTVVKPCICGKIRDEGTSEEATNFASIVPESGLRLNLQSNNTGGGGVKNKDGEAQREATKVVKVEPFNSHKKRMGVVIELPESGFRVHTKGASEIILAASDKFTGLNMAMENPPNFKFMVRNFSDTSNGDNSSVFSECNSDRSGETSSRGPRLLIPRPSDNSDDLIQQLVAVLEDGSVEEQKQAAMNIRLLAKNKSENRLTIARNGAIKPLISLLSSTDLKLQENGVTAILNLSLCDENKELIAASGAIKPLVRSLKTGTATAKENAACALVHLSRTEEKKVAIGRSGAIPQLVNLLKCGRLRGKKDASTALYWLCSVKENKIRAVESGIMKPLLELMADFGSDMVDKSVCVLSVLVSVSEACAALVEEGGIPVLVDMIVEGSQQQKEISVAILLQICKNSGVHRNMVAREALILPLVALSQSGNHRSKQNAETLTELLRQPRSRNVAARASDVSL